MAYIFDLRENDASVGLAGEINRTTRPVNSRKKQAPDGRSVKVSA
jgi:hypothetical protein